MSRTEYVKQACAETLEALRKIWPEPFVLEFTAFSPYDGCGWETNYLAVEPKAGATCDQFLADPKRSADFYPVYLSGRLIANRDTAEDLDDIEIDFDLLKASLDPEKAYSYELEAVHRVDDDLHEHVHESHWRNFSRALPWGFSWKCSVCGKKSEEEPQYSGYRGNGGIGVQVEGAVCESCISDESNCRCCHGPGTGHLGKTSRKVRGVEAYIGFCPDCWGTMKRDYAKTQAPEAEEIERLDEAFDEGNFDRELEEYLSAFPEAEREARRKKAAESQKIRALELAGDLEELIVDSLEPALAGTAFDENGRADLY